MHAIADYIRRHWRGEHSLVRSFWINLVLIGALAYAIQAVTARALEDTRILLYASIAEFVLFRLVLFTWQAVGVLRACEHAMRDYVPFYWTRLAQAVVVVGMVWVVVDALGVVNIRNQAADRAARARNVESAKLRSYTINASPDGAVVHLSGPLDPGVTRDLRAFIAARATPDAIVLDSEGGSIYEARGLAKLIAERGIDTYSLRGCNSACTTAFIAGRKRWLGPQAGLGFHQYQLVARNVLPNVDSQGELQTDFAQFAASGIDVERLARALTTPSDQMWFPGHEVLLQAGVIDGIATPPGWPVPGDLGSEKK